MCAVLACTKSQNTFFPVHSLYRYSLISIYQFVISYRTITFSDVIDVFTFTSFTVLKFVYNWGFSFVVDNFCCLLFLCHGQRIVRKNES